MVPECGAAPAPASAELLEQVQENRKLRGLLDSKEKKIKELELALEDSTRAKTLLQGQLLCANSEMEPGGTLKDYITSA